ncbi:MAG: cell division protein FtsZ, partial [Candidatus Bipolaricaulota bacterium]|nr:cell division protein FtsZ [Candidatus Bipolaricaulota bacterium]MDW8152576.1 cell division protein FtsZ [Candidatus Bipolaricaulota bacterium]
ADEVLHQGVQGVTELVTVPGLINLDFADLEAVLRSAGTALMGIGEAEGEGRTREAARRAISSPLLDFSIKDAKKAILNITGGEDLTLEEVVAAASVVREALSERADIFFGATIWEGFSRTRVTVIATGFSPVAPSEPEVEERTALLTKLQQEGIIRDDYDIPAFIRRTKSEGLV